MIEGTLLSSDLRLAGRLDARFFALLAAIEQTGSINRAARTAGYSYKGAWLLLESAANLANEPLLESAVGGKGGGGTRLTSAAIELLAAWNTLQSQQQDFLRQQEAWLMQQPALAGLLRRISMKTTARNQFAGTISQVDTGPITTQVTVAIAGGHEVVASMTTAASNRMGLVKGMEAIALVKS
ncbi:MAG TPA: TOBE domain-containing protein, partial [Burkholderiaceae bacterium]